MLDIQTDKPLYMQLSEAIAQTLIAAKSEDGKLPSIREIADKYKVSVITAIKAVDRLKAEGIVYGRPGKGLYVKDKERLLECYATKAKTIGVTFLDIYNTSSAFLSEVIRGLSSECSELGLNLQVFSTPSDAGLKENPLFWKNIRKKKLDGLILASRMPLRDVRLLQEDGIPFVWVNVDLPSEGIYCATGDKLYSINMCLKHAKKLGHRKIAVIGSETDDDSEAYYAALCPGYGISHSYHVTEGPEVEVGYQLAKSVIETDRPDLIITRGTELTASALNYITEQNIRLPDDLAVIAGVSNRFNPFLPNNLTVLTHPAALTARKAVDVLHELIEGRKPADRRTVIPAELAIRGSCGFKMDIRKEVTVTRIEELDKLCYTK